MKLYFCGFLLRAIRTTVANLKYSIMETLQQTALNLRNAGIENIKKYCEKNNCNDDFEAIKKDLFLRADENNLKLPIDFYIDFYNLTITELN